MFSRDPRKLFERELERCLSLGWEKLVRDGLAGTVVAYGIVSPEGMECVEPYVLTKEGAGRILKEWGDEKMDPRCALAFPVGLHQGALLEAVFAPVTEAYEKVELNEAVVMENGAWALIEDVVIRVLRRLDRKKLFGDRAQQGGPFLGYFGYEMSSEQLSGHLLELNPKHWVAEWIADILEAPPGDLHLHGKTKTEVSVDDMSRQGEAGLIATTGWDGSVRGWSLRDMTTPLLAKTDWEHGITAHAVLADGSELFAAWRTGHKGCGLFRHALAKKKRTVFGLPETSEMWALACHPSAPWLIVGLATGLIRIWDYRREVVVKEWAAHGSTIRALVCAQSGAVLYSSTREEGVRAWEMNGGECLFSVPGDGERLVLSPDEKELVVMSCGNVPSQTLRVLDACTGEQRRVIELNAGHEAEDYAHMLHGVRCAAISDDGAMIAVGVGWGEAVAHVRILDFKTGAERERAVFGHECVSGITFAPGSNRRVLFSGRHFRGAQLYDWTVPPV